MRIWITRAEPEASATAERVRALGHEPVLAPVMEIQPAGEAPDIEGVGALAFTSRNGVRAFAALSPERGLKVFTVGDATARAAREAGFADVESASGDVAALVELIAGRREVIEGEVLYPAPQDAAGDLAGELVERGVPARAEVVYRTVPTGLVAAPDNTPAVLIHSAGAARRLTEIDGLPALAASLSAICISASAAEPLRGQGFRQILVADAPNETSLIQRLDAWAYAQKPVRLFPPQFWIAIGFAAVCIVAAIVVASLGPRLFSAPERRHAAVTAQPLQFRGKSG